MSTRPPSALRKILASDLFALLLLVLLHHLVQANLTDFLYLDRANVFRWAAVINSVLPSVMLYAALRLVLPNIFSVLLVAGLSVVISLINQQKQNIINEVLAWADLANVQENLFVAAEFIAWWHVLVILGLVALGYVAYRIQPRVKAGWLPTLVKLGALALLLPWLFVQHLVNEDLISRVNAINQIQYQHDLEYARSNWPLNVKKNGLGIHLIQTSARKVPSVLTPQEQLIAQQYASTPPAPVARSKTVIVILCEACWHDKTHLTDVFDPLLNLGFRELRAVSPSFGGGTANASFEILTGLPANNVLTGVVYQEYAALMRGRAITLASGMREAGYHTVAAHNYRRQFWHRHEVKPKFGFDRFIAIEDMNITEKQKRGWIDDRFLYDSVQETLGEGKPTFFYLTTMYTHAPFRPKDNDNGIGDYKARLTVAVQRMAEFLEPVIRNGDVTVMVYGDHKPALTKYFVAEKIFTADMFVNRGLADDAKQQFVDNVDQNNVGDMPILIFDKDQQRVDDFIRTAEHLPYYCLSHQFNQHFLGLNLPTFAHASAQDTCSTARPLSYVQRREQYPSWLYRASLF